MKSYLIKLFIINILFATIACKKENQDKNNPDYLEKSLKKVNNLEEYYEFNYNSEKKLISINKKNSLLEIYSYHYLNNKIHKINNQNVEYLFNYKDKEIEITTISKNKEILYRDVFKFEQNLLTEHINYYHSNNTFQEENKYNYYYFDGNLVEIKLFTKWSNNWKNYGNIKFEKFDNVINRVSSFDHYQIYKDYNFPYLNLKNTRIFHNNPLEINYYDDSYKLLRKHVIEYKNEEGIRKSKVEKIYIENTLSDSNIYNYEYLN